MNIKLKMRVHLFKCHHTSSTKILNKNQPSKEYKFDYKNSLRGKKMIFLDSLSVPHLCIKISNLQWFRDFMGGGNKKSVTNKQQKQQRTPRMVSLPRQDLKDSRADKDLR